MKIIFEAPLNQVSFGNVSYNILREFYKLSQENSSFKITYFPVSNPDLSAFNKGDTDFHKWLKSLIDNRYSNLTKDAINLKLWHINGAEKRLTRNQVLFSFYELDEPTAIEKSIVKLQDATIFSSQYAKRSFEFNGCENVFNVPLGFDQDFVKTNKKYLEGKIHFLLMGKFEKRKHTDKIIKLWAKKFGNNPKYQLSCCILNPFLDKDLMKKLLIGYKSLAANINILPYVATNSEVNDILPSGKTEAYDGIFFKRGSDFNQGSIYDFNEDEAIQAIEKAANLAENNIVNTAGIELGQKFTYKNTVDNICRVLSTVYEGSPS